MFIGAYDWVRVGGNLVIRGNPFVQLVDHMTITPFRMFCEFQYRGPGQVFLLSIYY